MKLPGDLLAMTAGPRVEEIDARWLMAYAAALGDTAPEYLDTRRPGGVLAHPLFPVCYEWPLAVELRARLPSEVAVRAVHATHDLRLQRLPRAGDRLRTTARVVSVEPRRSGTLVVTRFETVDAGGAPVSTTDYGSLYRGVGGERTDATAGSPAGPTDAMSPPRLPDLPEPGAPAWAGPVHVAAGLAHVYTECARIWNPIHTDRAVAHAAGLPDPILHGTATLALAVSQLIAREGAGDPTRARRVACRFGAMVPLPSTLTVERLGAADRAEGRWLAFHGLTPEGHPALREGRLLLA